MSNKNDNKLKNSIKKNDIDSIFIKNINTKFVKNQDKITKNVKKLDSILINEDIINIESSIINKWKNEKEQVNNTSIIYVKDIVKCWENINILNHKENNNLYKFVEAIKNCNSDNVDIKFQKLLERQLMKQKNLSYLKLFFSKNKIMKTFYLTVKENLEKELKRWEKTAIMNSTFFKKILNNTLILTYGFFEALASCIKSNNYLYNTLFTKIYNYILHDFIISKQIIYKYLIKCNNCDKSQEIDALNINLFDCENCDISIEKLSINNVNQLMEYCEKSLKTFKIIKKKENIKFNPTQAGFLADKICIAIDHAKIIQKELDNEKKANIFIINKDLKAYLDQYIITVMFKPPMVVKPKPWKSYSKKSNIMYEGGYYNNLFLKVNISFDKKIFLNNNFKTSLNYIQDVPLRINLPYLNYLLNLDVKEIVTELQTISVKDLNLYFKGEINLISSDKLNIINELSSTLYFSKIFSKFNKLYIPMHYDFRGRIYCSSYPLNYHSHTIYRGLYVFAKPKQITSSKNFYNFFRMSSGDIALFNKFLENNELYSKKDFYLYKAINFLKSYSMIGIDACSSTFQIQGLLTKDIKMMKYCNMLNYGEKLDLYKYVMEHAYKDIKDCNEFNSLWKLTNNENKLIFDSKEKFNEFIKKLYTDRKLWKGCIMKLGYNQQTKSRSQEMTDYIVENYLKILNKKNKSLLKLTFFLSVNLEKTFYKLFESQLLLKKFMSKAASIINKKKDYIIFKTKKYSHIVWQSYHKPKYQERWFNNKYTSKKIHVRFAIYDESLGIDKNKIKIATLPNLIQYYDSSILINFLTECKKKKLDVKTIHDNFLGHYEELIEFKSIYYKVLSKTLLSDPDPLWVFIESNELQNNKTIINLYNNIIKKYGEAMLIEENISKKDNKKLKEKKYQIIYKQEYYNFIEYFNNQFNSYILSW